jgi:hypothetical protein
MRILTYSLKEGARKKQVRGTIYKRFRKAFPLKGFSTLLTF